MEDERFVTTIIIASLFILIMMSLLCLGRYTFYPRRFTEKKTDFCGFLWFVENPTTLIVTMTIIPILLLGSSNLQQWQVLYFIFASFNLFWVIVGLCCKLKFTPYVTSTSVIWLCMFYNQLIPALAVGVFCLFFFDKYEDNLQLYLDSDQLICPSEDRKKLIDDDMNMDAFNGFIFKQTLFLATLTLYICYKNPDFATRYEPMAMAMCFALLFFRLPLFMLGNDFFIGKFHGFLMRLGFPMLFMPWLQRSMVLWTVHGFKYRPINSEET